MSRKFISYEFCGLLFTPETLQLKVLESETIINLTPTYCRFLLALIEKMPESVSYAELNQIVWGNSSKSFQNNKVDDSVKHNIHTTKGKFTEILQRYKIRPDFIKTVPRKGYRFEADDLKILNDISEKTESLFDENNAPEKADKTAEEHLNFGFIAAFFYGLLFAIGILLESAFGFDNYGTNALLVSLPLIILNGSAMFAGLFLLVRRTSNKSFFWSALLFLFAAAFLSSLIAFFVLPNEPLTPARFQTQPAFAAFAKNVFIYFLPLGVFFILIPFETVTGQQKTKSIIKLMPSTLFGMWFLALIYSVFSTFYLLDNLLRDFYHGFYTILIFARFFLYFGLSAACLLWYREHFKAEISASPTTFTNPRAAMLLAFITLGLIGLMFSNRATKSPVLEKVEITTAPDSKRQFFINLKGTNFQTESVSIRVVGADCRAIQPCLVPHGALKKHSEISEIELKNVPLTLPAGEFHIFAQNGDSPLSNSVILDVP